MAHIYNSQLNAFTLYHQHHQTDVKRNDPVLPALGHAIAGSTGTAISNLAIYPLDLIITRLQVQRQLRKVPGTAEKGEYKGVIDAITQIYDHEGGLSAFYTGVLQDTGKSIADSFLFFLFYNYFRARRFQQHGSAATSLPVLDELAVGAMAGACSKFFTTPISNIVTRKQTAMMFADRSSKKDAEPSVKEIADGIRAEKGILGLWSGYSASLVLTLNPSITFFLYETFRRALLPRARRDDPGARTTFLMAAISKAVASSITYPFSLAKTRAQISSNRPVDAQAAENAAEKVKEASDKQSVAQAGKYTFLATAKSTVFGTILRIYKEDGLSALYEGVLGEVIKGFFSHGTTMLVKELVHKFVIQIYFLVLSLLKKYPPPAEIGSEVGAAVSNASQSASNVVSGAYEETAKLAGKGYSPTVGAAKGLAERAQIASGNVKEGVRSGADATIGRSKSLVNVAREQVGKTVEDAGRRIKSNDDKKD